MNLISEFADSKAARNKNLKIEFQGKYIYPCKELMFWFRWGEWIFDIREIRTFYNKKEIKKIDFNFKINYCTKFKKRISEVVNLVGETPFEKILNKIKNSNKIINSYDYINTH